MTLFVGKIAPEAADDTAALTRDEIEVELAKLRRLVETEPQLAAAFGLRATALGARRPLNRTYPHDFVPDAAYRASMPDLQNGPASLIKGARAKIQHVGISNFRLPLTYRKRDGGTLTLETSVTGSVSLEAQKKGINMSRIMRSFYGHADEPFDFEKIEAVVDSYLADLESFDARIQLRFRYPMLKRSLRSGLEGYQYYDVAFELIRADGVSTRVIHLDYVYSSTCPCSLELSEHARDVRGQIATPHSQRSVARVSVALSDQGRLWIEDIVDLCVGAIATETQVMVKREDEQAFAELNGSNPIFVEDAVRLLCEALEENASVGDFRVIASHQESLHSHDAVSILTRGSLFAQQSYDPRTFDTLYHVG
ncbi:MAG: GTP cyclohydrolase FolE2 [Hyphomicrobiaceae bacterium]